MNNEDHSTRMYPAPLTHAVKLFMALGCQTVDKFNATQACFYLGMQFEELGEKIAVLADAAVTESRRVDLKTTAQWLKNTGDHFKRGMYEGDVLRANHAQLIDADFDLAWVSIAALASTGTNVEAAIAHGAYTNMDKVRDGVCKKDGNGKILKPADWRGPDFEQFVDPAPRT